MKIDIESIYQSLPSFAQQLALDWRARSLKKNRYGPLFERCLQAAVARAEFTKGQLDDYRAAMLSSHLKHARHSPYWADQFAMHSVNPDASDPFAELAKLPVLTKGEVRKNLDRIANPLFARGDLIRSHTGGSTGSGLVFHETREAEAQRWALWWRYRLNLGLTRETLCGHFGGRCLIPLTRTKPPFWRISQPTRQVIFSTQHLRPETVRSYVEELAKMGVTWIHGYPSGISLMATWMLEQSITPPAGLAVITTGSENLTPAVRQRIRQAFGVPVYQHYGMAESVANFSETKDGLMLVDEDFAATEFIPFAEGGHQIIGTNWHNPAFPLFRYAPGDSCELGETSAGVGLARQVLSINGREQDFVRLRQGTMVGAAAMSLIFADSPHVVEAQFVQREVGMVEIRVVKGAGFGPEDESAMRKQLTRRFGSLGDYQITYVDTLPRTANGKLRLVISDLPTPAERL
jgi:phenylacetate-CoA ligase